MLCEVYDILKLVLVIKLEHALAKRISCGIYPPLEGSEEHLLSEIGKSLFSNLDYPKRRNFVTNTLRSKQGPHYQYNLFHFTVIMWDIHLSNFPFV